MLQFTGEARRRRIKEAERQGRRLDKSERKRAVTRVAAILGTGEPTYFAFEASCRHSLRAALCLDGMPWPRADATADEIVAEALAAIGSVRPSWSEGQREWTNPLVMRTHCAECGKRLPDPDVNHPYRKYCSQSCNGVAAQRRYKARKAEGERILLQPILPERRCEHCSMAFKPKKRTQSFCCVDCRNDWERTLPERPCEHCGGMFKPLRTISQFCSKPCQWQAWKHNVRPAHRREVIATASTSRYITTAQS